MALAPIDKVQEHEPSTRFRSFWKKTGRPSRTEETPSVSSSGPESEQTNRTSRLLKVASSPSSDGGGSGVSTQSDAQKRRQQVYQAQKRHRNRKAEYITSLEDEVARLQKLDAHVNGEKTALAHQNDAMRELLAAHSTDVSQQSVNLPSQTQFTSASGALPGGFIDTRFDNDMESDRIFIDIQDVTEMHRTPSASKDVNPGVRQLVQAADPDDSWAALDFILALEWPCRDHVRHHALAPTAWAPKPGEAHGHALTATAAVFASAQPPVVAPQPAQASASSTQGRPEAQIIEKWQLPRSEIDKLVDLSRDLELDDAEMTPAQAYSAICGAIPNEAYLRPALESLKQPLGRLVNCVHFGAVLATASFWQHFEATMQSLRFTRPGLGT